MQADNTVPVNLAIQYDSAASQQALQGITTVEQALQGLDQAAQQVGASQEHVTELINQQVAAGASLSEAVNAATVSLNAEAQSLDQIGSSADNAVSRLQAFRDAQVDLSNTQPTVDEITGDDGSGGGFGGAGLSRGLSSAGMLARRAGAGGLGAGLQDLSAITRVETAVSRLSDSFTELPGILGAAATEGEALAGGLGATLAVAGPLVVAIGAVAAAYQHFTTDTLEPANKALEEAKTSVDTYYDAIGKGTKESIQKQLDALEQQKKDVDDKVQTITNSLAGGFSGAQQQFGDLGARLITAGENAGAFGGGVQGVNKDLDAAKQQSVDLQGKIEGLQRALQSTTVATTSASEAEKKLYDERQKAADKAADVAIQQATQNAQLEATGTSKSVQDRISQIEAERQAIFEQLFSNDDLSTQKTKDLNERLANLANEENNLTDTVLPAVEAREAETAAIKDTTTALKDSAKAVADFFKETNAARQEFDTQSAAARAKEAQAEADQSPGSLQDTQSRAQIRLKTSRAEEQSAQQSADKIVDIRTKLGQDETRIQTDFARQIQDDQTTYDDNIQKAVLAAHRTAEQDQATHLQNLANIDQQAKDSEFSALLNRNFLQLAQDEHNKQTAEAKENTSYDNREQALQTHLTQQEADLTSSLVRQETQQQVAEERKLADAQTAENYSIQQENTNEQRKQQTIIQSQNQQLQDLTTAENYKIQILRVGLQNELALYAQHEQERIAIALQTQAAIISRSTQQLAASPFGQVAGGILSNPLVHSTLQNAIGSVIGDFLR
jgi:hypothetical protein